MTPDGQTALPMTSELQALLGQIEREDQYSRDLREALGLLKMGIDQDEHESRIRYALGLNLFSMAHLADVCEGERIAICGSGPSLAKSIPYLRQAKHKILACNGAHDFLLANGIKPTFGLILDPREWCSTYQTPTPGVTYLIASTVHHSVWQRFRESGIKPWLFIPILNDTDHENIQRLYDNEMCFVAGGTTVGLRGLNILLHLGASVIEGHGFDSCYAPGQDGLLMKQLHAHSKPHVDHDARIGTVRGLTTGDALRFRSNGPMSRQIIGFNSFLKNMPNHISNGRMGKTRLIMAGDGVIPWMAWKDGGPNHYIEHLDPESMKAKYGDARRWDYFADAPFRSDLPPHVNPNAPIQIGSLSVMQ